MKKIVSLLLSTIMIFFVMISCATGYSKRSFAPSLEKFVSKVEKNWKSFDEGDWVKADKRMDAFEQKYDKYANDFTKEEVKEIVKQVAKYKVIRAKAKGKSWLNDFKDWLDNSKVVFEDGFKDLKEKGGYIDKYIDSIGSLLK